MTKILFFAGSNGSHSINAKLALEAKRIADEHGGVTTTYTELEDYPMPLYCSDLEERIGIPEHAKTLKAMFMEHDGVFIASPEYNSSFTPLLKNTIDWISRVRDDGEPMLPAFKDKVYAIGATSPGAMGGYRGLIPLRLLLSNIGIFVTPNQIAIGGAGKAFDDDGRLDERNTKLLTGVVTQLIDTAKKLAA